MTRQEWDDCTGKQGREFACLRFVVRHPLKSVDIMQAYLTRALSPWSETGAGGQRPTNNMAAQALTGTAHTEQQ